MKVQIMFKKVIPSVFFGLTLLTACESGVSQKTALVSTSVCNNADQPLAQVYLNGNYAGGGNREYGESGSVCCSRISIDQPITVEWEMSSRFSNPKPMPSYKVTVPVLGVLRTDEDNYLAIHVDEKGNAKVVVETEERYFGPKAICDKPNKGVKHD